MNGRTLFLVLGLLGCVAPSAGLKDVVENLLGWDAAKTPVDPAKKAAWDKRAQAQARAAERKDDIEAWIRNTFGEQLPAATAGGGYSSGGGGRSGGGGSGRGQYDPWTRVSGGGSGGRGQYDPWAKSDNGIVRGGERPSGGGAQTAECSDGTTSYSAHFQGTCSGHHGVKVWLDQEMEEQANQVV
jgi:hypothetical protein